MKRGIEMKRVCIFLADGFEEVEALTVVDLLRRADVKIDMVSISDSLSVRGRSNIEVTADLMWEESNAEKADMLILPGGMPGVKYLGEHKGLTELIKKYAEEGKKLAAICAAPTVFGQLGILKGKKATCYPGLEDKLIGADISTDEDESVITDGNITTSRGVGTAIPFALCLITILEDKAISDRVKRGIVY